MKINFAHDNHYVIHNILDAFIGIRRGQINSKVKLDAKFEKLREACADYLPAYETEHKDKGEYYFISDGNGYQDRAVQSMAEQIGKELPSMAKFIENHVSNLNGIGNNLSSKIISDLEGFFGLKYNFPIDVTAVYSPTSEGGGTVAYSPESNKAVIVLELNPAINDSRCPFDTFMHELVHLLNKTSRKAIEISYWKAGSREHIKLEEAVASVLAPCGLLSEKYGLSPFIPESQMQKNLAPFVKDRLEGRISFEEFCKQSALIFKGAG